MFSNALPLESSQVWPLALLSIYQMLCSEILWLSGLPPVMEHSLSIQSCAAHWHKLQGESGSSGIYLLSAWKNSMCLFLDGTGSHLFSALVLVKIIWLLFLVLIISQWSNCCFFWCPVRNTLDCSEKTLSEASCPSNLQMWAKADWMSQMPPITKWITWKPY